MIDVRRYGAHGPTVAVLHGGPGAPGDVASLARALADAGFVALEPLQRRSGGEALTVARHVADLRDALRAEGARPTAIVGHSWGAMLALAFAAEHPELADALVLIGCGTFDRAARAEYERRVEHQLGAKGRAELALIAASAEDPDLRLERAGAAIQRATSVAPIPPEANPLRCDAHGNHETWSDLLRLRDDGTYPAAFAAIRSPVLMLHGAEDPHPGALIRDSLAPVLPQLEYVEFPRCGHYPWLELHARDVFLAGLRAWLQATLRTS